MTKVGIALGGGGVAGCAHIGALCALEEAGIQIDCLAGSSAGAIIAALYAYGYSTKELMEMVPNITKRYLDYDYLAFLSKLIKRHIKIQGLIKGEKFHDLIANLTQHAHIAELKFPLALLSSDLKQARQVVFTSRPLVNPCSEIDVITDIQLAKAVQASISIPVLFKPVMHKGRVLVDGGVMDNCPISAVQALGADKVIAVNLVFADPVDSFDSLFSILARVVSINLAIQAKYTTRQADIVLHPEVSSIGLLDFSKLTTCMEAGYDYTRKRMKEIKAVLTEKVV
ncbi:patatin-like phospholipase family protein [Polycladomyces subterraneus]|uniref:Patatin-like phospholipase family protein n=1 Tax=Polycladomyces subterraneus TaxID=1016997 RepID=A0ABT8IIS3_9BACL|nr:patatin-like phospholipase family protein [Polycladomyces subterraneus]MDN4592683.1 patatin-like phospholipase family protein [Polycladomyces subterraneus]